MPNYLINQPFCSDDFIRSYENVRSLEKQVIDLIVPHNVIVMQIEVEIRRRKGPFTNSIDFKIDFLTFIFLKIKILSPIFFSFSKVQVIIWDTRSKSNVGSHLLHHASVAAIGISPNDRFVASAGGQDDPSILIWDIDAKTPVCGKTDFSFSISLFLYILQKKIFKSKFVQSFYISLSGYIITCFCLS